MKPTRELPFLRARMKRSLAGGKSLPEKERRKKEKKKANLFSSLHLYNIKNVIKIRDL